MNEKVTVEKAILKGHLIINVPVVAIMIVVPIIGFYLAFQNVLPYWTGPVSIGLAFGLAWLYWSIMITKWRLWAFENVRNVHELKKRAIQEKLIWADNSIFEKTEIRISADKKKWVSLQNKLINEDIFIDDIEIPIETKIYYSKSKSYFEMVSMLGCVAFGIYLIIVGKSYLLGAIFLLLGAYLAYKEYKVAKNVIPQIIINEKGIETISTGFCKWVDIENEEVKRISKNLFLTFNYPNGYALIKIDDFDTSLSSLSKLLILYRGRNQKLNKDV